MHRFSARAALCAVFLLAFPLTATAQEGPLHGLAMHGAPKYGPDFTHFEYVNPDAPKGGTLRLATSAAFDNLNPYIVKGVAAPGVALVYQTLMTSSDDEAFSEYGEVAKSMEMPQDRGFVVFNLREEARWHDGRPLTADDVVWTFNTLMEKGHPFYRAYYAHVKEAKAENAHRVRFTFDMTGNRELPLIMGQMPVLPRHWWEGRDFSATLLEPPLGSGPYRVASAVPQRRIVYERVKDWWAADLPVNRGRYNFDRIVYDVFRDETVLLQALFAGEYDFRQEHIAKAWATEYDHRAVKQGLIRKEEIRHEIPAGMQAFVFNTRRPMFRDPRVRRALAYAFDFEWSNRQFAYGAYTRTDSYFENSELASSGVPQGRELEILEKYRGQVPDALFTTPYTLPRTSGSGRDMRENLLHARRLLNEAGWKVGDSGLMEKDGVPFRFQFLLNQPAFERWLGPFVENLKKLGVEATLRVVDTAQYQARIDSFDFDMVVATFGQSLLSPGNEQLDFWGSEKADVPGSRNLIGVRSPVVDDLIRLVIAAPDREELVARTRALDRVLLWGDYVIPNWHVNYHRLAYWDKFGRPAVSPRYGLGVADTWWHDAGKAASIAKKTAP